MTNLMHKFFNTFITILYMYMFRAVSWLSSGGQIVLTQHLVSSLSSAQAEKELFSLNLCTGLSLTEGDDIRCCVNKI
jgi:hypothetical protein